MQGILISAKAISPNSKPYLSLDINGDIKEYQLNLDQIINIEIIEPSIKYCCGWYDISTHTNHTCPNRSEVSDRYESCFMCRNKTNFNPAFYNSTQISEQQKAYNLTPHSVYIAYFGDNLAKAGIMADSRGLTRLYEQGALLYTIVGSYKDAYDARKHEERLIGKKLSEAIRKRQKEIIFEKAFEKDKETEKFIELLKELDIKHPKVSSNLDIFSLDQGKIPVVKQLESSEPISGHIKALVGRYLIIENNSRYYGFWLEKLYGRKISIADHLEPIKPPPEQTTLL